MPLGPQLALVKGKTSPHVLGTCMATTAITAAWKLEREKMEKKKGTPPFSPILREHVSAPQARKRRLFFQLFLPSVCTSEFQAAFVSRSGYNGSGGKKIIARLFLLQVLVSFPILPATISFPESLDSCSCMLSGELLVAFSGRVTQYSVFTPSKPGRETPMPHFDVQFFLTF